VVLSVLFALTVAVLSVPWFASCLTVYSPVSLALARNLGTSDKGTSWNGLKVLFLLVKGLARARVLGVPLAGLLLYRIALL